MCKGSSIIVNNVSIFQYIYTQTDSLPREITGHANDESKGAHNLQIGLHGFTRQVFLPYDPSGSTAHLAGQGRFTLHVKTNTVALVYFPFANGYTQQADI